MIKKVLIFIILFIFLYDLYTLYNLSQDKKVTEVAAKIEEIVKPAKYKYLDNDKKVSVTQTEELVENINPNMFGKPYIYKPNEHIIWEFNDPQPWTKIVYKYGSRYPFYFFIKVKVPSLNDYQAWKNIIPNIDFDPTLGEIIIPSTDEESALSIINLILSNFKGDISIEEIINKNLIEVSINKAKKYEVVKNKLIEQIMINSKTKTVKESFESEPTFESDLGNDTSKISSGLLGDDDYEAYQGIEYSFI